MEFGKELVEISGIAYNSDNKTLLGISDNKEHIFQIDYKTPKLSDYTEKVVPPNSDLEDIVKLNDAVYIMASKGLLYEIPNGVKDTSGVKVYDLGLSGTNDFESLYYDSSLNGLVLLCKSCAPDKGEPLRSAFKFDLATKTFSTSAIYYISTDSVKTILKDNDAKFDPSAAAIHPINKFLYILSSAGNLLVITDTKGKVLDAYNLHPDQFPQAEGIAFAPDGTMFIANEGKFGTATLHVFPYK
ncbi:MAG TPA: SdiA-regulated domain-containing protein, partial [Flavisolibacter sp.]|nr:SdiA-regulated domain-containing protein [Flavisolibacter sp.]